MDFLQKIWATASNNVGKIIAMPFIANLVVVFADGKVTEQEFHALVKGATNMDLVLLLVALLLLNWRKP